MRNGRDNNFGALRLVAALFVLRGHMQYLLGQSPIVFFGAGVENIGVKIFFLIGGYLITKSWCSDPNPIRYTAKRFFRIWPPLAACVLFSALVIGPLCTQMPVSEYFASPGLWRYFRILLLYIYYDLPGVFTENPYPVAVNGSLWTLPVEVFMYVVIAVWFWLLAKCGGKENMRFQQAGVLVLMGIVLILRFGFYPLGGGQDVVVYGPSVNQMLTLIPFYVLGSVYATVIPHKSLNLPMAVCVFLAANCFLASSPLHEFLRMLVLSYLVFSFAFATPVLRLPKWTEISYGVYLFGFPIQQFVVYFAMKLGWNLQHSNRILLVCLLLVVPVAFLSEFLVERPAGKLCKTICGKLSKYEKEKRGAEK